MQNKISLIAAISSNGVIGNAGDLVFQDKEDMKHFRETTTGSAVVMGRKTWDSIPQAYRPLKDRKNVVISTKTVEEAPYFLGLNEPITRNHLENIGSFLGAPVFVIGGGQIYAQTIKFADELIISEFPQEVPGDTLFPQIDMDIWKIKEEKPFTNFVLKIYERK